VGAIRKATLLAEPVKDFRAMKRTLTCGNAFRIAADFIVSVPVLLHALIKPKTSAALREKIMLGVISINNCRLCEWGHTHWAMARGVPIDEVNKILGHDIESLQAGNLAEASAILFARHYAENLDRIDPESLANLRRFFSDAEVAEILAYVRSITLGSLTGNTFDAILGRLRRFFSSKQSPQPHS
jgi:AhpD family alkylhydroperoxidase